MATEFPDLLSPDNLAAAYSDAATNGKKKKKKSKKKKLVIENLPDVDIHLGGDVGGTSNAPIHISEFEDASEIAIMCNYKYQDFVTKSLPVVMKNFSEEEDETVEIIEMPDQKKPETKKKSFGFNPFANMTRSKTEPKIKKVKKEEPMHIDLTELEGENFEDADLEGLALTYGRPGLISGTPGKAAYDKENRKFWNWGKKPKKQSKYNIHDTFEDEVERSWKAGSSRKSPSKRRRKDKKWMAIKMTIVAFLVLAIVFISVGIAFQKKKNPSKSKPLSAAEFKIHTILLKISSAEALNEHGTAQNRARNWLLYSDRQIEHDEAAIIQRYILACLYFSTNTSNKWLKNKWLQGPECGDDKHEAWDGIDCNANGEVRALVLDEFGLGGTIPAEIGHLYKLENLILKNNAELTGTIPTTLAHLGNLRQLGLYNNNLSGVIPDIFEHTKSLKFINLENNNLHGSIPLEISNLSNLETLVLKNNHMEGIVPFEQLSETSIKYLGLSNNRFASTISYDIHDCDMLEYLYLDNNALRGQVPAHIGNLSNLKALDLGNNSLTGFFPGTIGNLEKLEFLSLNNNKFSKNLPLRINLLSNLRTLNVATNTFTGNLPDLSSMSNLKTLHAYENDFSGPFPETLEHLDSIESIFLSSNRFTGTIPESISLMSRSLTSLYLSDNYFEGTIPTHLCEFVNLEALFMDTNKFSGPIPDCFGDLTEMKQLYLFGNELTGEVPESLQNLKELSGFGIEHNDITGQVPNGVCGVVHHQKAEMWADCGADALQCACCSVCCADGECLDH